MNLILGTISDHRKIATFLFILSVAIRLSALWLVPEPHLSANASIAYLGGAHMLHEGEGFRDPIFPVFTPPLYALLIAGGLSVFDDDQVPIKLAQVIADSFTTVVVYFVVLEVFTVMSALLSGLMWAVYPFSVYATLYIGVEAFFTLLLSVFVLLVLYALKYGKWSHSVGAGLVLGLATLTRGTTQMLPLMLPFAVLANPGRRPRWVLHCVVVLAACVLVVLPWSLRNYLVLQEVIPVASVAGGNFLFGSSEQFWTIKEREEALPRALERLKAQGAIEDPPAHRSPVEADRYALVAGLENYRLRLLNDPVSFVPFGVRKFLRLWYATESGANHGIILAINLPLYGAFVVGVVLAVKQGRRYAFLLLGLLGYFVVLHLAMVPLFRYMLPVMPYLIAFASFALCEKLGNKFSHWEHRAHAKSPSTPLNVTS